MTWWSWILLWSVLVLGGVAVLALFAVSYWRKGTVLLRQIDVLLESLDRVAAAGDAVESEDDVRPPSSLFADRSTVARAHEMRSDTRRERARDRREARVRRGKLLVHRNPIAK